MTLVPTAAPCSQTRKPKLNWHRRLPKMTQLISMEPRFQPTSVCSQRLDWFCKIRLPAEEETESWGGSLGELAQGRTLAPHAKQVFGDTKGRQQKLQLLWTLYRTPPLPSALMTPLPQGNMALVLQAQRRGGVCLGSQAEMPHLCPGGHLQFPEVEAPGGWDTDHL